MQKLMPLFVAIVLLQNGLTRLNQMFSLCSEYLVDGLCEVCTKSVERFFIYHIFCKRSETRTGPLVVNKIDWFSPSVLRPLSITICSLCKAGNSSYCNTPECSKLGKATFSKHYLENTSNGLIRKDCLHYLFRNCVKNSINKFL